VDDTHCRNYRFFVDPARAPAFHGEPGGSNGAFDYFEESVAEGKDRTDATHPVAQYRMDTVRFQDVMVLESQGSISPRENEHLATSDRGIALLRKMLFREIEKVQQGLDPIGVFRDPDACTIDTHTETVMPDRHRWLTPNGVRIHVDRGLVPVDLRES
jgi:hypothetical protein